MKKQRDVTTLPTHPSQEVGDFYQRTDEIDIRELLKVLWHGKLVVIAVTLLFSICAFIFVYNQPSIYQSKSLFSIDDSFFGFTHLPIRVFCGDALKELVQSEVNGNVSKLEDITVTCKRRNDDTSISTDKDIQDILISIDKKSQAAQTAYEGVVLFSNALNQALKKYELDRVNISIKALTNQSLNIPQKSKDFLDEMLAQELFKKSVLENSHSKLVWQIQKPIMPTSHIKPKRIRIVVLGMLLGGMLGVAIVLVRFTFSRENDEYAI